MSRQASRTNLKPVNRSNSQGDIFGDQDDYVLDDNRPISPVPSYGNNGFSRSASWSQQDGGAKKLAPPPPPPSRYVDCFYRSNSTIY